MKFFSTAFLVVTLVVAGCASHSSIRPAQQSPSWTRVALAMAPETIRTKGTRSSRLYLHHVLEEATGLHFEEISPRRSSSLSAAFVGAALIDAQALLFVHPPTEMESQYVGAALYLTNTGEYVGDTVVPRSGVEEASEPLIQLLEASKKALRSAPAVNAVAFSSRLATHNQCRQVAEFISEYEPRSETEEKNLAPILGECRHTLIMNMEIPEQYLLRLVMKDVPESFQEGFIEDAVRSGLREKVFRVSKYLSDLFIDCEDQCKSVDAYLMIPFDGGRYTDYPSRQFAPLNPYREVAGELLVIRDSIVKRIRAGKPSWTPTVRTKILLQDVNESGMKIYIEGSPKTPMLEAESDVMQFLTRALMNSSGTQ